MSAVLGIDLNSHAIDLERLRDLVEQPAKGAAHTDLHEWAIGA